MRLQNTRISGLNKAIRHTQTHTYTQTQKHRFHREHANEPGVGSAQGRRYAKRRKKKAKRTTPMLSKTLIGRRNFNFRILREFFA